jgi:hypothetical protein
VSKDRLGCLKMLWNIRSSSQISHNSFNTWKNCFCQISSFYGDTDIRQTEMYTAEPLAHEPSSFEVKNRYRKAKNV